MREPCRKIEDLLIASTLHPLSPEDRARLDAHLEACTDCRRKLLALEEDDRRLTAYVQATDRLLSRAEGRIMTRVEGKVDANRQVERGETTSTGGPLDDRPSGGWLHRGWLRVAIGAAAAAVVLIVVYLLSGGRGASVAWAEVIERVIEAQDYICRIEKASSSEPAMEIVQYCSGEYGLRQDLYKDGKQVAAVHLDPVKNELVTIIHAHRQYAIIELNEEDKQKMLQGSSAQAFVAFFRGDQYEELGRKRIDGTEARGIETVPEGIWGSIFEKTRVRLWVDVTTRWPVRLEFEGEADDGKTWMRQTMKDFQWNPALAVSDFAYQIPDGFESIGTAPRSEINEESAITGLRHFARLVPGTYPDKLVFTSVVTQFEKEEPRLRKEGRLKDKDILDFISIQNSCRFFAEQQAAGADPAYYGDRVGPADFDKVLLRWRLEDSRYRVIYGDLRAETVTAERLAELERR